VKTEYRSAQKQSLAKGFACDPCQKQGPRLSKTKGAALDVLC